VTTQKTVVCECGSVCVSSDSSSLIKMTTTQAIKPSSVSLTPRLYCRQLHQFIMSLMAFDYVSSRLFGLGF